jgi:tRNA(Ile)-lysidine synthase
VAAARRQLSRPPAVARVLERVTKTSRVHGMFGSGCTVLVCVSGGPDSVCLLESLVRLRRLFRIGLEVVHVDHRLRPDSARDAHYVRRLSERHGLPVHLRIVEERPGDGISIEAWASLVRTRAIADVRAERGLDVIAEGHTRDDQAETVLLNLIRGTGLEGMAGILPRAELPGGGTVVQPLLEVERAEVEAYCRSLRLRPRRDPMNEDRRLLRAAIRLDALPALARAVGRDVQGPIVRTAANLRLDRDELEAAAARAAGGIVRVGPGSELAFDAAGLAALSAPLASRVVRRAIREAGAAEATAPWTKEAIEAVCDLARGRPGRRRDLPNGSTAERTREYVRVFLARSAAE